MGKGTTEKDWICLHIELSREVAEDTERISPPFQYQAKKRYRAKLWEKLKRPFSDDTNTYPDHNMIAIDPFPYTPDDIIAIEAALGSKLSSYDRIHLAQAAHSYFIDKTLEAETKDEMFRERKKHVRKMKEACEVLLDAIDNSAPVAIFGYPFFSRLRNDLERMHAQVTYQQTTGVDRNRRGKRGHPKDTAKTDFILKLIIYYELFTGKKAGMPSISRARGEYDGPFMRFAAACLEPLEKDEAVKSTATLGRTIQEIFKNLRNK